MQPRVGDGINKIVNIMQIICSNGKLPRKFGKDNHIPVIYQRAKKQSDFQNSGDGMETF